MRFASNSLAGVIGNALTNPLESFPVFCICTLAVILFYLLNRPNSLKPKTALAIVLTLVITGEAIADCFARNISTFIAVAILIFSVMLIHSIRNSQRQ